MSYAGVSLLMQAVSKHRYDFVFYLCDHAAELGLNVNSSDRNGWNAVMYAASSGQLDVLDLLITRGVQRRVANDGRSILMQAALIGDVDMIEYLLDWRMNLELDTRHTDIDGWNCLYYAIQG